MTQSTTLTRATSLPAIDQHRRITHRTRGHGHGPIVRLMSPSDLGEIAKPFVFLDLFEADMRSMRDAMALHPHSDVAIATAKMKLTVLASASAASLFEAVTACLKRSRCNRPLQSSSNPYA